MKDSEIRKQMNFKPGLVLSWCQQPTEENSQTPISSLYLPFPSSTLHDSWRGHTFYLTSKPPLIVVLKHLVHLCRLWIVDCELLWLFHRTDSVLISSWMNWWLCSVKFRYFHIFKIILEALQGLHHILFLKVCSQWSVVSLSLFERYTAFFFYLPFTAASSW